MGKRKSKARVMKKEKATVGTVFDCLFCNHKQTVECKMDYRTNLANIKCRVCNATFQSDIHHLSDPIDVYSEWVDATEGINKQVADHREGGGAAADEADEEREIGDGTVSD